MAGNYVLLTVPGGNEALMAILSEAGFEAFEENENEMVAYLEESLYNDAFKQQTEDILQQFSLIGTWGNLPYQNWNEVWESNFSPVEVPGVCRVRAEFHPKDPGFPHEITIHPRMAFGTGHHQTTFMMLKQMANLTWDNKRVFDFGCGTGILAIFASMLGAEQMVAIDIEHESYLNSLLNAGVNGIDNIEVLEGGLEEISDQKFDVVLANINRNVLTQSAQRLAELTKSGGTLLLSGILEGDFDVIVNTFEGHQFLFQHKDQKDAWLCLQFKYSL